MPASDAPLPTYLGDATLRERKDGGLRWAVGVHEHALFRVSRTRNADRERTFRHAFTHAPMLAHWAGRLWLSFHAGPCDGVPLGPHPPVDVYLACSADGRHWSPPCTLFACERIAAAGGAWSHTHQRTGFYLAPNGRLLATCFMGRTPNPNDGNGYARLAREIRGWHAGEVDAGPVFAVRYNAGYGAGNLPWRPFDESTDDGFVAACSAMLDDARYRQQWCEEDSSQNSSGFFAVPARTGDPAFDAKAFASYPLPDGRIVGLWKKSFATVSEGEVWASDAVPAPRCDPLRLREHGGSKIWGERTSDGRYALIYDVSARTAWDPASAKHHGVRCPLVVTTGDDGLRFTSDWMVVSADVPTALFKDPASHGGAWDHRDGGPQYVRGIEAGGPLADDALWLTYSVSKESIWCTEVPVPITATVDGDVEDDFSAHRPGGRVTGWNIRDAGWCPVGVVAVDRAQVLRLADADPHDHARAFRVFRTSRRAAFVCEVTPHQEDHGELWIEAVDRHGQCPVRLRLLPGGEIRADDGDRSVAVGRFVASSRLHLRFSVDCACGRWRLAIAGQDGSRDLACCGTAATVERICFRTGPDQMTDWERFGVYPHFPSSDLADADEPVREAVFDLHRVVARCLDGAGEGS